MYKFKNQSKIDLQDIRLFGGPLLKSANAREPRYFSRTTEMNVLFLALDKKSNHSGSTRLDFRKIKNKKTILFLLKLYKKKFKLKKMKILIHQDQIHLRFYCRQRKMMSCFLRSFAGVLSRKMKGAEKGRPSSQERLWSHRPLSFFEPTSLQKKKLLSSLFEYLVIWHECESLAVPLKMWGLHNEGLFSSA